LRAWLYSRALIFCATFGGDTARAPRVRHPPIELPKSIEELFGKRRNNEAKLAILLVKLP
jgi:hypothetical protein